MRESNCTDAQTAVPPSGLPGGLPAEAFIVFVQNERKGRACLMGWIGRMQSDRIGTSYKKHHKSRSSIPKAENSTKPVIDSDILFFKRRKRKKESQMKQTRKEIQDVYFSLCSKKPADKITVREIVDTLGINRNSFYYHFEDLPSLVVSIFEDTVRTSFVLDREEDFFSGFIRCAQKFQDNLSVFRNIYYSKYREVLDIRLSSLNFELISDYMNHYVFPGYSISKEDQELITKVYQMELNGLLLAWLQGGMRYDLVAHMSRIFELREGTLRRMLEKADVSGRF